MPSVANYPEIQSYLDTSENFNNVAQELTVDGQRALLVTQEGQETGGQLLFIWDGTEFKFVKAGTVVDIAPTRHFQSREFTHAGGCSASSNTDHAAVAKVMVDQVGKFSSASGPDHGNLACCWAVRHIVQMALGRWITRSDDTAEFGSQLAACFGNAFDCNSVPDGGIVISPTGSGNGKIRHGHVGLLGAKQISGDRLIYSNSSSQALWEQNWTVEKWKAHYGGAGLKVLFYPLPLPSSSGVA